MGRKKKVRVGDQEMDATIIPFRGDVEHWNEYLLDDRTVLRLKSVVTEVARLDGQYDAEGNPIYVVNSTNVTHVSPPEDLKKGGGPAMTETVAREDRTDALEISLDRSGELPDPPIDERVRKTISEAEHLPQLPMHIIEKYSEIAVRHATLKRYPDGWFAEIPGFQGVWAKEGSKEQTLEVLKEVVLDWTLLKVEHHDHDLPVIEEIDLNVL